VLDLAGPYTGETWPDVSEPTEESWRQALSELKQAHRELMRAVSGLTDSDLERQTKHVRGPLWFALHGTVQHTAYHAGQIQLMRSALLRS
jgi:uncharacterized damage-inducible protein DinB